MKNHEFNYARMGTFFVGDLDEFRVIECGVHKRKILSSIP